MKMPRPIGVKTSSRQQNRSNPVAMKPNPPEWMPSDELIQMEAQLFPDGFTLRDEANAITALAFRNGPIEDRQVVGTLVEPRAEQDHGRGDEGDDDQRVRPGGKASQTKGDRPRKILSPDAVLQPHVLPAVGAIEQDHEQTHERSR